MCGIAGAFGFTTKDERVEQAVESANEALKRRGPDGGAYFQNKNTILGHRRVAVIDVSCAGDQPMHSPDGRYTIAFNGEIFNFQELRDKFLSREEQGALRSHFRGKQEFVLIGIEQQWLFPETVPHQDQLPGLTIINGGRKKTL